MNSSMTSCSNIPHRRRGSEVPLINSEQQSRRGSNSFHDSMTSSEKPKRSQPKRRPSRSFHCSQDLSTRALGSSARYCDLHPEIALGSEGQCPECAIRLMKLAAKTLERRAAELELERKEKEMEEIAKKQSRRERKLVSSKSSDEDEGTAGRQKEIKALLRWSTGYDHGKSNTAAPKRSTKDSVPPGQPLRRKRSLGEVARKGEVDTSLTRAETLIKIARLREGDGVWVKRSDDVWTYATLKARENGPDASLVFIVNDRGATKKFPVTHWAKFVRIVVDNSLEEISELEKEEEEIEAMFSNMSDPELDGPMSRRSKVRVDDDEFSQSDQVLCRSSRRDKGKKSKGKAREDLKSTHRDRGSTSRVKAKDDQQHTLRSSHVQPLESGPKAGKDEGQRSSPRSKLRKSQETTGQGEHVSNKQMSHRAKAKKSKVKAQPLVKVSEEHVLEKSLETFSSDPETEPDDIEPIKDYPGRRAKQEKGTGVDNHDHEVSMYTFAGVSVDDSQSQSESVQDHDVSMYTFWGDQNKMLDDGSCTTDGQDDSCPPTHQQYVPVEPILKRRPTPDDEKAKRNVSFLIPENTREEEPSSSKSSMTTTSEHSSSAEYDADVEGNGPAKDDSAVGFCKVSAILKRSSSVPLPGEEEVEDQAPSNRRKSSGRDQLDHRVSWTDGIDQIKEELLAGALEQPEAKKPVMAINDDGAGSIPKKKLKELNMGKTIPKHMGKVRQASFHSALKSIHRRSSVMMPPTSNVSVNLN